MDTIQTHVFELGTVLLHSREKLPHAKLVYATFGELNEAKDNGIVFPTYYGGTHSQNAKIIGSGRALDTDKYFIIVPNMFGNGISSSPSNTPPPYHGPQFPRITIHDNVTFQHRLVTEKFGIQKLRLVLGWSMGAQQAYQWSVLFPKFVERLIVSCGSAKTSPHNFVFLEGVKAALTADSAWNDGKYSEPPVNGLKAFGRVYAGWAYSQSFFREKLYTQLGFQTIEDLLVFWENDHLSSDANDLLCMLWTWQNADISNNNLYNGDLHKALKSIEAKVVIMPCNRDLYFHFEDSLEEAKEIEGAEYRQFDSKWGHCAGAPGRNEQDTIFFEKAITDLLQR